MAYSKQKDSEITDEVWARYTFLRDNGHLDYVQKAHRCEDFFAGLQWEKSDLAILKASRRPALTINKIISTLSNVMGEQIFNRTEISFRPRNAGATDEIADALTKVFMQIGDDNQLAWVRSDVFCDGIISSRGFYDVRLDFTDSLRGDVRIVQLNPKNVLIDNDGDEYDPDKWNDVLITKWLTLDEIELAYGKEYATELKGQEYATYPYGYDAMDGQRERFGRPIGVYDYRQHEQDRGYTDRCIRVIERQCKKLERITYFVHLKTGELREVPEDWDRERIGAYLQENPEVSFTKKLGKRIRWQVVAASTVLHDEWSPYKHFTVVPYFPHFRRGRTIGLVENLIGAQEYLNKIRSQELHVVNTTANSGWIVKSGALTQMSMGELEQRGAQTGVVIEVDNLENIEKIQPNQVPTGLDRLSYKGEEDIKNISGVSDYQTGNAREDVSAKAVRLNQSRGSTNLARVMDNLTRTDYILARNVLDLVQTYYTEERMVYITNGPLTNTTNTMNVNQITPEGQILNDLTLGEYRVIVSTQPERDTMEDTQFEQAVMLRQEVGVQIPDQYLIQASRLRDKAQIVQEITGNQDSPEAKAQQELKMRGATAEVAKLEADVANTTTSAELNRAKAQKELAADPEKEMMMEMQMEMKKLQMQFEMDLKKLEMELQIKREEHQQNMQFKQEEHAQNMQINQQDAVMRRATMAQQAAQKAKTAGKKK